MIMINHTHNHNNNNTTTTTTNNNHTINHMIPLLKAHRLRAGVQGGGAGPGERLGLCYIFIYTHIIYIVLLLYTVIIIVILLYYILL